MWHLFIGGYTCFIPSRNTNLHNFKVVIFILNVWCLHCLFCPSGVNVEKVVRVEEGSICLYPREEYEGKRRGRTARPRIIRNEHARTGLIYFTMRGKCSSNLFQIFLNPHAWEKEVSFFRERISLAEAETPQNSQSKFLKASWTHHLNILTGILLECPASENCHLPAG